MTAQRRDGPGGGAPPVVVIADDEVHVVDLLALVLEPLGVRAVKTYNGDQALRAIREQRPRLVITDYMMPKLDGIQLIRGLRRAPELAEIPIVLMSSLPEDALPPHEATAYISKPFDLNEMESLLTRYLAEK